MTRWYLRDAAGRYYDGCGWAADRSARHVYAHRWLAVLVWQAVGGYIYYERMTPPTPDMIRTARREANLSAREAGALVNTTCRVWQQWEAGDRAMHAAFWELFAIKARRLRKA